MPKELNIDTDAIHNIVIPIINNGYNNVSAAESINASINIPSDFSHYEELSDISKQLRECKENISDIKEDLQGVANIFDETEVKNRRVMEDFLNMISFQPADSETRPITEEIAKTYSEKIILSAKRVHYAQLDWTYYKDGGRTGGLICNDIERNYK